MSVSVMFLQLPFLLAALETSIPYVVGVPTDTSITSSALYGNVATHSLKIKDDHYGVRTVSYWVNDENDAIVDGDVIYPGNVDNLLAHAYTEDEETSNDPRAFSIFRGTESWPNSTVVYKFSSDATANQIGTLVNNAINAWKTRAPYLNFVRLANSAGGIAGVLTINANACGGCNANVGYYGGVYSL